jgi:lipopolysaccharide export system protein LptA
LNASRPTRRCARALPAVGAALAVVAAGAAVPQLQPNAPITVDARSSEFDYRNSTLVFQRVRIAQGPLAVEADQAVATGLNFDDSRWTFKGNVRITTADGSLSSNDARVQFAKNQISSALITGGPAAFEQRREDGGVARGRANRIEYDFGRGTVRLSEGAWLSDGRNEINGRTLVYSMRDRRVLATASEQNEQRVRITINPQQAPRGTAGPATKPATPAP